MSNDLQLALYLTDESTETQVSLFHLWNEARIFEDDP